MTKRQAIFSKRDLGLVSAPSMTIAVVIAGMALSAVLTFLIIGNDTQNFDEASLLALRKSSNLSIPIGPRWLFHAVVEINSLGSLTILILITLIATIYLLLLKMKVRAGYLLASVIGGWVISNTIKFAVARPRPAVIPHLVDVSDPSYPSGHAMMSTVTYLTIAWLLSQIAPEKSCRIFFVTVAALMTFMVGLCRIYLGVHYPTDVLAGWCFGATWAVFTYRIGKGIAATRDAS